MSIDLFKKMQRFWTEHPLDSDRRKEWESLWKNWWEHKKENLAWLPETNLIHQVLVHIQQFLDGEPDLTILDVSASGEL